MNAGRGGIEAPHGDFTLRGLLRAWWRVVLSAGSEYQVFESYGAAQAADFMTRHVRLPGARILDLGSSHGGYGDQFAQLGASVVSVDLVPRGGRLAVRGDALHLPFRDKSFDGVICSNMLEHVGAPKRVFAEMARVLRAGGWAYVSWTNWYSPWGGHEFSPWHYLGVRASRAIGRYVRLGPAVNIPGVSLFPVHVGEVLRLLHHDPAFTVREAVPRYWPFLSFILRVPVLREVATWNCLLLVERTGRKEA